MIYCVEDERNIRELLVYTLHSTGFEAKGLENGTQLFEELGNLIPDLILLDIMLPGDDGYTILEKIRQMPEVRDWNHCFNRFTSSSGSATLSAWDSFFSGVSVIPA